MMARIIRTCEDAQREAAKVGLAVARKLYAERGPRARCVDLRNAVIEAVHDRLWDHPTTATLAYQVRQRRLYGCYNSGAGDAAMAYLRSRPCRGGW
jgi:hypothetical protein